MIRRPPRSPLFPYPTLFRSANFASVSSFVTLSSEPIGARCSTLRKRSEGVVPTRCVGESGRTSSGCCSSSVSSSSYSRSNSASDMIGSPPGEESPGGLGGTDVEGRVSDVGGLGGPCVEPVDGGQHRIRIRLVALCVLVRDD